MTSSQLKKAESYIQTGKLERAEKELRRLLSRNTKIPEAWLMLASVYGQTNRFVEVAAAARKVIALNPSHQASWTLPGPHREHCRLLRDPPHQRVPAHDRPRAPGLLRKAPRPRRRRGSHACPTRPHPRRAHRPGRRPHEAPWHQRTRNHVGTTS